MVKVDNCHDGSFGKPFYPCSLVVVFVRYVGSAENAERRFFLDLFGAVRAIAGLSFPAGNMLLPIFV